MSKLSIIIPSRNELFMPQTVDDLFKNAGGEIEVIVVLDGYWPDPMPPDRKGLVWIHRGKARGMRAAINSAESIASGEFLMKCDAHCLFGPGYDEILKKDCEDNWLVFPRRFSLDAEKWICRPEKEPIDYEHYFYPFTPGHEHEPGLHARPWMQRTREKKDILIDEDMSFQGSCWFMRTKSYRKWIGFMDERGYETFMGEPQEIGLKLQLGPAQGMLVRNKKTFYAHLHKGSQWGRMYHMSNSERVRGNSYSFDFWWNNRWTERVHDVEWLIDHFWPVPGWPTDWKDKK